MKNILNRYLTGASIIALAFSLPISKANATCSAMPTCAELGYNNSNCGNGEYVKCPFDKTKMKCLADPCQGYYPSSENGGCYPGIGELTYCSSDSSKCRYTRCYERFYDDPSSSETGVVFQDGKCIQSSDAATCPGYYYLDELPNFIKYNPLIDFSETCGDKVKPSCKLGIYWYGECDTSNISVGERFDCGYMYDALIVGKGGDYIDVIVDTRLGGNSNLGFAPLYGTYSYDGVTFYDSSVEAETEDMNGYDTYKAILEYSQTLGWYDPQNPNNNDIGAGYLDTINIGDFCPALVGGELFLPSAGQIKMLRDEFSLRTLADSGKIVATSSLPQGNGNWWGYEYNNQYGGDKLGTYSYTSSGRIQVIPAIRMKTSSSSNNSSNNGLAYLNVGDLAFSAEGRYGTTNYYVFEKAANYIKIWGDNSVPWSITVMPCSDYSWTSSGIDMPFYSTVEAALADQDGQGNTEKLLQMASAGGTVFYTPDLNQVRSGETNKCNELSIPPELCGQEWYIPSAGEMHTITTLENGSWVESAPFITSSLSGNVNNSSWDVWQIKRDYSAGLAPKSNQCALSRSPTLIALKIPL